MDTEEIKHDFAVTELQCCLCLSIGRKLVTLGDLTNIYLKITEGISSLNPENFLTIKLCWECKNLLRKVLKFREQVVKAQEILKMGQNYIYGPLSNLTAVTLSDTQHTIYLNEHQNISSTNKIIDNTRCNTQFEEEFYMMGSDKRNEIKDKRNYNNDRIIITENTLESTKLESELKIIRISELNLNNFDSNIDTETSPNYNEYKCFESNFISEKEIKINSKNLTRKRLQRKPKYKMCIDFQEFHSKENKDIECKICGVLLKREDFKKHYQNEHKVIQCLRCGMKFGNRRIFYAHYKEWHEKYICDHCGVSFKMRYSIKNHIRKQHSTLKCNPCNKSFKTYSGLWRHNKLEHTPASPAYCVECDKSFKDIYRYKWHLCNSVKHAPRKKKDLIPCTRCDKAFTKKTNMTEHYDLVHLKIYRYRCEVCDKNYVRNADLKKHKRRLHEGILPPKDKICTVCGRGFSTNTILKNHQRTHNRDRGINIK